jgi:hypothetical protein
MIKILSKREALSSPLPKVARVYVGRPTALGNPYQIGIHGTREEVIEKYRSWLDAQLLTKNQASEAFKKIEKLAAHADVELVCWCAPVEGVTSRDPLICHAQVIAQKIESLVYVR